MNSQAPHADISQTEAVDPSAALPDTPAGPLAGIGSAAFHLVGALALMALWDDSAGLLTEDRQRDVGIRLVAEDLPSYDQLGAQAEASLSSGNQPEPIDGARGIAAALPPTDAVDVQSELPSFEDAMTQGQPDLTELPGFDDARDPNAPFPSARPGDAEMIAEERAQIEAGKPQGTISSVSLFRGSRSNGRSFVFAIDRSQSMGAEGIGALDAAAKELGRAVGELDPTNRFQILAYNRDIVPLGGTRKLLPADEAAGPQVRSFIAGLAAFGPTDHETAVYSALSMKPEVIYLLTDGGDPPVSDSEIARIGSVAGGRTSIHVVCFGLNAPSGPAGSLRELAERNGGAFTFVDLSKRGPSE